jgi:hypothetical protein
MSESEKPKVLFKELNGNEITHPHVIIAPLFGKNFRDIHMMSGRGSGSFGRGGNRGGRRGSERGRGKV